MTSSRSDGSTRVDHLRLWPGVVAVALQWLAWFALPMAVPEWTIYGLLGTAVFSAVVLVWWLFFSRAPWPERLGALVLMPLAVVATSLFVHPSVSNGFMGMMLYFYAVPALSLALVAGAVISRGFSRPLRRAALVASIAIACGALTLIRTDGITGEGDSLLRWRWTPTAEERLLAREGNIALLAPTPSGSTPGETTPGPPSEAPAPSAPLSAEAPQREINAETAAGRGEPAASRSAETPTRDPKPSGADASASSESAVKRAEWPGFRGHSRDSIVPGLRIDTDWTERPPVELWRRAIGPGWSSFAVSGDRVYTQEQRGDEEVVSCYRLDNGEPVWRHGDPVRFWESNGGAGPRGTPTLYEDHVYTMGATGVLNTLRADTGALVWSRNAAADTEVTVPDWGVASSPLVNDDLVIVAVSGRLAAYDRRTGEPRWFGPIGGAGYSSPHLVRLGGVEQVMLLRGNRTISVAPRNGTLLWEHTWQPGVGIVQPAVADGDVLIGAGDAMGGQGLRRLAVSYRAAGWNVEERWTSRGLKPYFNDFVVHKGHAYGFDGSILAAIDLSDGTRTWKGGRYGHGQMLLLPEQDLLVVLSEDGELALVRASPDKHAELARVPALNGKTWNHPAIVGDIVLVRNGEEMAAFRLPVAAR